MLAMQYSFTLPADYDMTIIERRIAENGHRLDGYPGLVAWDTQNWQLIRFYLWQTLPTLSGNAMAKQNYQIGHISLPKQ